MHPIILTSLVLVLIGLILFPSQAFSADITPKIDFEKIKILKEKFNELKTKTSKTDSIPIIIGLDTDFVPEGKLKHSDVNFQKTKIRQDQDSLLSYLKNYRAEKIKKFDHLPFIAMTVDKATLQRLEASPRIAVIAEDTLFKPLLTQSVPLIGAPNAWARGFTGQGQAVGILDTGVNKTHSFFAGNKVKSEACFSSTLPDNPITPLNEQSFSVCPGGMDAEIGANTGVQCPLTIAGCDHGTHVAGIAAGNGVGISGVAKDADIIAIQIFSKFTNSAFCANFGSTAPCILAYNSDIASGLDHIATLSNIISIASVNLSLGGGSYTLVATCDADPSNSLIKQSVENLRSKEIATVAAAGNDGSSNSLNTPACLSSVVSVGSTTKTDTISSFSNSASFLDLLAPGESINSSIPGNKFGVKSGTSMATPHVAGAWAVLKSGKPTATVTEVLNSLKSTGKPILDTRNGLTFPRIQVDSALDNLVPPTGAPWFDPNWQFRKQITIDRTKVAATLTDFPVLISITDANLLASAQADGDDIVFTSADGTTKLSHEIESWNDTPGKLAAWVKVPNLSSSTNTILYMYYGNAAAVNQENVAGTWRSEYKAVYHLHDDFQDSTANNNDCTNEGSTNVAGRIADAQEFDGIDDILRCGSNVSIDDVWSGGGTISVWLEADTRGESNLGRVFYKYVNMDYPDGESAGATRLAFQTQFTGGFGTWRMNSFPITYNNWHLVHQTYNSNSAANNAAFWVNGNSQAVTKTNTPSGTYLGDASSDLNIGNAGNTARTWDGKIDEFRIYDGTLSASWITTEYNNQNNPAMFYTVGIEEIQ